ncbi:MAG: hypothetical protein HZB18_13290 [Chloroflexi bacterium]|nr:hypothetical protein [Chloroflexota bacterium]
MTRQNLKQTRLILLSLVLMLSLTFSGLSATQVQAGGPPSLFGDAADVNPADFAADAPFISRSRFLTVDFAALFNDSGDPYDKESLPEITLNLFPDTSYVGKVNVVKKDRWATSWNGPLKGKQGYFYLVVSDGVFTAHVASPEGVYEVKYAADGLYKVVQLDHSQLIDDDPNAIYEPSGDVIQTGDLGPNADTGATIDIMIAYTDDARAAAGSTAAMKALIALAVLETNTAYANAGITTRLRLVHVEEYAYAETGNMSTDLSRFMGTADAYFTTIHSLRNTYAADMVGLVVANGGAYCGLASSIMATASTAFQVTDNDCATGYYSFGHEFGHLQGARHDVAVDNSTTPYTYGHGYVNWTGSVGTSWRTVMAYGNACGGCTRLQWWSNPAKTYGGSPMGNGLAMNYLVLNNTAFTVANFRTAIISSNFNSTFNGSSAGWTVVNGVWALNSSAYYKTNGVASQTSSIKHSGTYGDLTYEARMKKVGGGDVGLIIRGTSTSLTAIKDWRPSYYFGYTNAGTCGVYYVNSSGGYTALKSFAACAGIVASGFNTLKVKAVGSSLKFYINNTLVWSGSNTALRTGQAGVYTYSTGAFYVDWAKLSTTPTADYYIDAEETLGEEVSEGEAHTP